MTIPSITSLSAGDIISFNNPTEINNDLILCTVKNASVSGGSGFTASSWQAPFVEHFISVGVGVSSACTYDGQLWHSTTVANAYLARDLNVKTYKANRFWFNFDTNTDVEFDITTVPNGFTNVRIGVVDSNLNQSSFEYSEFTSSAKLSRTLPKGSHFIDIVVSRPTNSYTWAEVDITVPSAVAETSSAIMKQTLVPLTHLSVGTHILVWNGVNWTFLGHQQAQAVAKDENPESPFYIYSSVGEIRLVLYSGEYDNIYSDELAQQRANYELWKRTRLEDTITLTCVPIPWLDVNQLVEYTSHESSETHQYIIKSITTDYNETGTQTIVMSRYYPLYPDI